MYFCEILTVSEILSVTEIVSNVAFVSVSLTVCRRLGLYIYLACILSVLSGAEDRIRLHFQHQGVFKRMFVPESGGELLCIFQLWCRNDRGS